LEQVELEYQELKRALEEIMEVTLHSLALQQSAAVVAVQVETLFQPTLEVLVVEVLDILALHQAEQPCSQDQLQEDLVLAVELLVVVEITIQVLEVVELVQLERPQLTEILVAVTVEQVA
jgi:hypothetical protein